MRRLPSVETLGCTTVICSDKTGTLTTNQMSALEVATLRGASSANSEPSVSTRSVGGASFDPAEGSVEGADGAGISATLAAAAAVAAVCNDARLEREGGRGGPGPSSHQGARVRAAGAPTEAALLTLAEKVFRGSPSASAAASSSRPLDAATSELCAALPRLATLEFDRERKSMSVLCRVGGGGGEKKEAAANGNGSASSSAAKQAVSALASLAGCSSVAAGNVLLVKGAAECVLARCSHAVLDDPSSPSKPSSCSLTAAPLSAESRRRLLASVDDMASRALRVLALAVRVAPLPKEVAGYAGGAASAPAPLPRQLAEADGYEQLESGLALLALVGLQDPPRPEVRGAVRACRTAGVRVIVITGDNRLTAEAICDQIGVFGDAAGPDAPAPPGAAGPRRRPPPGASITGREFADLSPAARAKLLSSTPHGLCVSRAEPSQKQDVVRALRALGEVTAMTGDGVNDAPALKLADIGIAMGIAGTQVAKEASDMVLADDNFSSIVAAIEEGRAIYDNMKAFIRYEVEFV